jgi:hypothetical protein
VNGQHVATETFTVTELDSGSITTSELHADANEKKISQKSELYLNATGGLQKYQWQQVAPSKEQCLVFPKDDFLNEHLVAADGKVREQPFLLPVSTVILDDYFFSQREILLWRYLGENCRPEPGKDGCQLIKTSYGALIPRQQMSAIASVEYKGREAIQIKGEAVLLDHFVIESEGPKWDLWMDGDHKVQRVRLRKLPQRLCATRADSGDVFAGPGASRGAPSANPVQIPCRTEQSPANQ